MKNKRTADILIFSIAVIMLLLRPYFVYQITENPRLARNPIAVNNLFQRLIKKKDDHHSISAHEFLAVQSAEKKIAYPLPHYTNINNFTAPGNSLPAISNTYQRSTVFKVCPRSKYYGLLSKFQI